MKAGEWCGHSAERREGPHLEACAADGEGMDRGAVDEVSSTGLTTVGAGMSRGRGQG